MPHHIPYTHQIEGARFLAARTHALLADEPRVGKTGTAILAADDVLARRILVVTTASGRAVWRRAFADWSMLPRSVAVLKTGAPTAEFRAADVQIIGWAALAKLSDLGPWDLILVDESHYAKSVDAQRTKILYGEIKGVQRWAGLVDRATRVWCLTGTPIPNAPNDLFAMLRSLNDEALEEDGDLPSVETYEDFLRRYCIVRKKQISRFNKIDVVIGGRNLSELRARMAGFWLRRTQKDVGITQPIYEMLPVELTERERSEIEASIEDADEILAAAETGETKSLDMELGTLRRLTGAIKASGVVRAIHDDLENGIDKIVVMAWHRDTLDLIAAGLEPFGVVKVTGATSDTARAERVEQFSTGAARVFCGQIVACGEAIDLSAAADLVFAESSFNPKDMKQAALRITNHNQTRQPRVRVAALEGSVDEALQAIVIRKMQSIKEIQS